MGLTTIDGDARLAYAREACRKQPRLQMTQAPVCVRDAAMRQRPTLPTLKVAVRSALRIYSMSSFNGAAAHK